MNVVGDITASNARFSNIITAQTLVVQVVSSSTEYASGSNIFGNSLTNTHQFTGSVLITGSMGVGAPSPLSILHVSSSSSTITGKVILQSPSSDSGILQIGSTYGEASMMFIPGVTSFGTSTGVIRTSTYGNAALWGVGPGTYTSDPTKFGISNIGIGGNILTVSSSGALGIGTTSPTERLDVVGGGLAAGNGTIRTGITYGTIGLIGTFTNHDLGVITNGTTKLFISASGNVGIGVTPTQTAALTFADSLAQKILLNNNANNYRIDLASAVNGGDAMFKIVAGSLYAGEVGFYTTTNLRMLITSGGNVGIGTSSPSAKLHVSGATSVFNMLLENANTSAYSVYQAKTGNSSLWQWGAWNDNSYRVGVSGVGDYLIISSSGNVGVGTSTPGTLFQVGNGGSGKSTINSTDNSYGQFQVGNPTSGGEASIAYVSGMTALGGNPTSTNGDNYIFAVGASVYGIGGNYWGVGNKGYGSWLIKLAYNSTAWTGNSDIRLKDISGTIQNGLDKVNTLSPIYYTFKADPTQKKRVGLIAQEVLEILPEAVDIPETETNEDGSINYYGVQYTEVIPLLVKAIQELKAENDTLKEILQRNNIQ
jgi:hypothetical protein